MSDPVRAFDFWAGRWTVTDPESGELVGRSEIRLILADRVLHEHWHGVSGLEGQSFNIYDAERGRWHQTWVASNGTLLQLDGGLVDGAMELLGGEQPLQRIRWTPLEGGHVLQSWSSSADGGATWQKEFEGHYAPAGADDDV